MLKNVTIKSRLIFVVGFLSLMCVVGAVIGLSTLFFANESLRRNYEERLVPTGKLDRIARLIERNRLAVAQALTAEPANLAQEMDAIEQRMAEIDRRWADYMAGQEAAMSAAEKTLAQRTAVSRQAFVSQGLRPAMAALRAGDMPQAASLMRGPIDTLAVQAEADITRLVEYQAEAARSEYEANRATFILVRNICIAGMLFSVLLGAAICIWLLRAIALPLREAVDVARSVAAGDLTRQIEVRSRDETGQLLQALKDMNQSLIRIVSQVRSGTETITAASTQIASGNMDLSARTETQASSLEETAASMEELTSTVKQNADSAFEANQLAVSASEVAIRGGAVVSQVVETMGSINDSAKKIVDITGVIDSIAFQTNILALNAAVEAARAGEQGKGFAVVASEVRHLAQRSAVAARQIKELIDDSVDKVEVGARLVDQAGTTMKDIVDSVRRVTDIMGEISIASKEQTDGIQQVNQAISQMDAVTQQNAALVEEAAAAAESLREQATHLSEVVSVFKLQGVALSGRLPRPAAPVWPALAAPASQ